MLFHSSLGAGNFGKNLNNVSVITNQLYLTHNGSLLMPTGINAGDLLIVANTAGSGSSSPPAITASTGTGFALLNSTTATYTISTNGYRQTSVISYKIATGNEGGTTISSFMNSSNEAAILFHLRGNKEINSVIDTNTVSTSTAVDPPLYTITTVGAIEVPYFMVGTSNNAPTVVTNITPSSTNSGAVNPYAGITAGLLTSNINATSYTFNSTDGGNMNNIIAGRLLLST